MSAISAMDLAICIDTLAGSLSISDGGQLFKYKKEFREKTMEKLAEALFSIDAHIEAEKEGPKP